MFFSKTVKTPTMIQMENAECGAVCLGIVLASYQRYIPMETLRYQCGVSRNGCDAYNLIEAAKVQGLDTEAFRAEPDELKTITFPAIVWWDQNHFVVLEGIDGKKVYLNDPATGRRVVDWDEFCRHYSQVVIILKKGKNFEKYGKPDSFLSLLKDRISPITSTVILLACIQLALVFIGIAVPAFTQVFLDQILIKRFVSWLYPLLIVMSIVSFIALGFTILQRHILKKLTGKLSLQYSAQFLWHLMRLPIIFFYQRYGGEVIQRMGLNVSITSTMANQLTATILNLLFIVFYAAVMFSYDVPITIIGISTAILNLLSLWWVTESRKNAYARLQQQNARMNGVLIDTLQNIDTIKSTGTESFFLNRITGLTTQSINANQSIALKDVWLTTATSLAQGLAGLFLLGFGILRIMQGELTVGMLIAFQMLLSRFLSPVNHFVGLGTLIQSLKIDLQRLNDVLKNKLDHSFLPDFTFHKPPENIIGRLEMKNIRFGYAPLDQPIFDNFNLTVPEGKRIALVGPTGSGKTTLANLASGLFEPFAGEVLIDGQNIATLPKDDLSKILSQVSQEIFLFEGTVRENLTLWKPGVPDDDLWRALNDACLKEEIEAREGVLDAEVLPGGRNFSEGQRQRLEIARSLIPNPKILILDEATSALDPQTEAKVMNNLLNKRYTCLIITHRLSTIRNCDEIFVLDKGQIIQRGSHDEIAEQSGLYRTLLMSESFR